MSRLNSLRLDIKKSPLESVSQGVREEELAVLLGENPIQVRDQKSAKADQPDRQK